MSDTLLRQLRLLLIDEDPIFRLGFRVAIEQLPDVQVVAEAETSASVRQILTSGQPTVDLVVLDLSLGRLTPQGQSGLQLCQQLKAQYPNLPILLLSSSPELSQLAVAQQAGIEGFCPKGTEISQLFEAIRQVAAGQTYWQEVRSEERGVRGEGLDTYVSPLAPSPSSAKSLAPAQDASLAPAQDAFTLFLNKLRLSGLRQIEAAIAEVMAELEQNQLSALDRAILAGRRRELLASRWLVNWLLAPRMTATPEKRVGDGETGRTLSPDSTLREGPRPKLLTPPASLLSQDGELSVSTWQSELFNTTLVKLQYGVQNLTDVPLEIDIFRQDKKRELLQLVVKKLENILDELRGSPVESGQIISKRAAILQDLWQETTTDFLGKYYTLKLGDREVEVVNALLQDAVIVKSDFLDKIPLISELLEHLLFQTPLFIDNVPYSPGTPETLARSEILLDNLVIQVANAVVQPLLNRFADIEAIKQNFYNKELMSTREIERFRNDLSWRYRLEKYINEPQNIFESRYVLFVLDGRGIRKTSIYAPRSQELEQLTGIQLAVTLALESRDAIAPRLRSVIAFLGKGVVYFLTQVVGRGIGLIGRGIIQGIGNSLQDKRFDKNSE